MLREISRREKAVVFFSAVFSLLTIFAAAGYMDLIETMADMIGTDLFVPQRTH